LKSVAHPFVQGAFGEAHQIAQKGRHPQPALPTTEQHKARLAPAVLTGLQADPCWAWMPMRPGARPILKNGRGTRSRRRPRQPEGFDADHARLGRLLRALRAALAAAEGPLTLREAVERGGAHYRAARASKVSFGGRPRRCCHVHRPDDRRAVRESSGTKKCPLSTPVEPPSARSTTREA
jgi:hypothetical protein